MVVLAGCGSSAPTDNSAAPDANAAAGGATNGASNAVSTSTAGLTGAGATFPYPIYSKWFEAYKAKNGVEINYQSIGSGGGIKALMGNTVDFGASDAPLKPEEEAKMPTPMLHIPTVAGSVAIAYNLPGIPTGLHLTGSVLADIYLGKITKWNDPAIAKLNASAKLPSTAITVVHRSEGSGTTNIFTTYLKTISPDWAAKVGSGKEVKWPVGLGGKGNSAVAAQITQNPGAIGYIELAYALSSKSPVVALQDKDGDFVLPSVDSTTAAVAGGLADLQKDIKSPIVNEAGKGAYPIAGVTYLLVYKIQSDATKEKTLVDFLNWAMTDGQGMAKDLNYAPLPSALVTVNQAAISSISVKQ